MVVVTWNYTRDRIVQNCIHMCVTGGTWIRSMGCIHINFLCCHCTGKMITLGEGGKGIHTTFPIHFSTNSWNLLLFQNKKLTMKKLTQENSQAPTRLTHWVWQQGRHMCLPEFGSSCAWSLPASGPTHTADSKGQVRGEETPAAFLFNSRPRKKGLSTGANQF